MEENKEMQITAADRENLKIAATWARVIAIVYFICLGLCAVFMLFALLAVGFAGVMSGMPQMPGAMSTVYTIWLALLLVLTIVMFLPTLYLYRFAGKTLDAIEQNNETEMSASLVNLRKYFKLMGILTIVYMALGFVMGASMGVVGALAAL
jgi:uncharacterized membrane protein